MIKLSKHKSRALSQVSINFSAVFLASMVLPTIISSKNVPWYITLSGIIGTATFIFLSMEFAQRGKL